MRVDIRVWARGDYLRAGSTFSWAWKRGEECTGSISVEVSGPDQLILRYWIGSGNERRDASQRIACSWSTCHFGGARRWFHCPVCGRQCGLLYLRSGRFACRQCQRVSYTSQSGGPVDRLNYGIQKLEARIAGGRPQGMGRAVYEGLLARAEALRDEYEEQLNARLFSLLQTAPWVARVTQGSSKGVRTFSREDCR